MKSCINIQISQPSCRFSLNVYFHSFLYLDKHLVLGLLWPDLFVLFFLQNVNKDWIPILQEDSGDSVVYDGSVFGHFPYV